MNEEKHLTKLNESKEIAEVLKKFAKIETKREIDKTTCTDIRQEHSEGIAKELNFSNKEKLREKYNFRHNEDDYFMHELAYTIRVVFLNDLKEYQA